MGYPDTFTVTWVDPEVATPVVISPAAQTVDFSYQHFTAATAPTVPANCFEIGVVNGSGADLEIGTNGGADVQAVLANTSFTFSRDPLSDSAFATGLGTISVLSGTFGAGETLAYNYKVVT